MNEPKTERPVILWDCDEWTENLEHSEKKDAIESYLDGRDKWDGTITVYGYARMIAPAPTMDDAVDLVNEWFEMKWEDLQGEDGPVAPNSTCDAALEFLTVLHKDFVPWACEVVTSEEVNVAEWIAENRPDWLEHKA